MAHRVVEIAEVSRFLSCDEGELTWSALRANVLHDVGIADLAC
jgi:hypothetical protein